MIYGVILNDAASLRRIGPLDGAPYKGAPKAPVLYIKPANTVASNGAVVRLPAGSSSVEIGTTVGVVFGRDVSRIAPAEVQGAIEGYVLAADLSLPHASYYRPAIREKCFDGACPLGSITPAQAVGDVRELTLHTWVDGERVESRSLAELVRDVPTLVAEVSAFMTLQRGDILLVGVCWQAAQAGVGARVRVEADRLGAVEFQLAESPEV